MNNTMEAHKLVSNLTVSLRNAADCLNALSKQVMAQSGAPITKKRRTGSIGAPRGRRVGSTKLGQEKEAQILELLNRPGVPIPVAAIAKAFNVSRPTIYNIRDRSKLNVRKRSSQNTSRIVEQIQGELQKSAKMAENASEPQEATG